jgi:REP element-mobilizing transposase RayT
MKTNSWDGSESRPYRDVIGRRALPHDPPLFVDASKEIPFITICCKKRGANQLCYPEVASLLFQATQFYQRQQRWFVPVLLLMPDHVHFLASFSIDVKMTNVVASWKRFTSKHAKINWQRDFFDHRLRGGEGWREKSDYILQNPVRAGLIEKYEDWPYVLLPAER